MSLYLFIFLCCFFWLRIDKTLAFASVIQAVVLAYQFFLVLSSFASCLLLGHLAFCEPFDLTLALWPHVIDLVYVSPFGLCQPLALNEQFDILLALCHISLVASCQPFGHGSYMAHVYLQASHQPFNPSYWPCVVHVTSCQSSDYCCPMLFSFSCQLFGHILALSLILMLAISLFGLMLAICPHVVHCPLISFIHGNPLAICYSFGFMLDLVRVL